MIQYDIDKQFNVFETEYLKNPGKSPTQKMVEAEQEPLAWLSEPLKKMEQKVYTNIEANCYQEKHLAQDFVNVPQVELCRKLERQKVFGKFDDFMHKLRFSTLVKYSNCLSGNTNKTDVMALNCIKEHLSNINRDNQNVVTYFNREFKEYI